MITPSVRRAVPVFCALCLCVGTGFAEKVLVYDEDRGIVFVEKDQVGKPLPPVEKADRGKGTIVVEEKIPAKETRPAKKSAKEDIHIGRRKDPPSVYFKSGLEYFNNGDYNHALKNFQHAAKRSNDPAHDLWVGKAYRQLEDYPKMLSIMKRILKEHSDSDVADDALFEIAFYYHKTNDYEEASANYKKLAEQYPFGLSYSNGEEFLEVSRIQRQTMRAELVSKLRVLGFRGDGLAEAVEAFQKAYKLETTGKADRKTVMKIKEFYQEKVDFEDEMSETEHLVRRSMRWLAVAGFVALLNLVLVIIARTKVKQRMSQVAAMQALLNDIDMKKL